MNPKLAHAFADRLDVAGQPMRQPRQPGRDYGSGALVSKTSFPLCKGIGLFYVDHRTNVVCKLQQCNFESTAEHAPHANSLRSLRLAGMRLHDKGHEGPEWAELLSYRLIQNISPTQQRRLPPAFSISSSGTLPMVKPQSANCARCALVKAAAARWLIHTRCGDSVIALPA